MDILLRLHDIRCISNSLLRVYEVFPPAGVSKSVPDALVMHTYPTQIELLLCPGGSVEFRSVRAPPIHPRQRALSSHFQSAEVAGYAQVYRVAWGLTFGFRPLTACLCFESPSTVRACGCRLYVCN